MSESADYIAAGVIGDFMASTIVKAQPGYMETMGAVTVLLNMARPKAQPKPEVSAEPPVAWRIWGAWEKRWFDVKEHEIAIAESTFEGKVQPLYAAAPAPLPAPNIGGAMVFELLNRAGDLLRHDWARGPITFFSLGGERVSSEWVGEQLQALAKRDYPVGPIAASPDSVIATTIAPLTASPLPLPKQSRQQARDIVAQFIGGSSTVSTNAARRALELMDQIDSLPSKSEAGGWIACEERLPEPGTTVIGWMSWGDWAKFNFDRPQDIGDDSPGWWAEDGSETEGITHWMPALSAPNSQEGSS